MFSKTAWSSGNAVLPYRTVPRWIKAFREDRDVVQNNLRTGRTHMEKNTVQLLASLLNADRRWTACELVVESSLWMKPGLAIRTKLETPIKWMEVFRFSLSKESAPYTMCCDGDVHWGVWYWWGNIAPRCISKTDGKRCLQLQVPAAPHLSSTQDKTTALGGTGPIILHDNARSHTAAAVTDHLRRCL